MIDIEKVLLSLSQNRKVFFSEADFQFSLALEIQKEYPEVDVRPEYCPYELHKNMHIDILVIKDGLWIPIELKYKTKGELINYNNEVYHLKNHGAQDLGRYDFLKDVSRIEYIKNNISNFKEGYAILLTNDPSYLLKASKDCIYNNFSLENGIVKNGILSWSEAASIGTTKNRDKPIQIIGSYLLDWKEFSNINDITFKYLSIRVI